MRSIHLAGLLGNLVTLIEVARREFDQRHHIFPNEIDAYL